jgi:hypothetical protein
VTHSHALDAVVGAHNKQRKLYEQFIRKVNLFCEPLRSRSSNALASFLTSVRPRAAKLTAQERALVADTLEPLEFDDGATIINQGDDGDKFFVVEKGEVVALQTSKETGEQVEVGRIPEGAYFGERALLTNEPRAATIRAHGHVKVPCVHGGNCAVRVTPRVRSPPWPATRLNASWARSRM